MADINKDDIFQADLSKPLKDLNKDLEKSLETMKQVTIEANKFNKSMSGSGAKQSATNTKKLTDEQKKLAAAQKEAQRAAASLEKQRQRGLAQMAKQEAAERDLIRTSKMEARTYEEMSRKLGALNKLRKRVDVTTEQGRKKYQQLTQQVNSLNNSLKKMDKQAGVHSRNVGQYFQKAYVAAAAAITGVVMALNRVSRAVKESVSLYLEQQKQTQLVSQVFGDYAESINKAADATQAMTTVGNEQYQKLAVQAANFGVQQDKVNDAVQGSIGLAAKFEAAGLSQETALKGVALALNGDYNQLQRYIPALKSAKTESEKMAILQEAMASGFDMAKEQAKTQAGQLQQLQNTVGDVKEKFGELVMDALQPVIKRLGELAKSLDDKGRIKRIVDGVKTATRAIITFIVSLKAYALAQRLAAKAGGKFTLSLNGVKKALQGLKSSLAGVGIGLFVVAMTEAVKALVKFVKETRAVGKSIKDANIQIAQETGHMNRLFEQLKKTNPESEKAEEIRGLLNDQFSDYIPYLIDEKTKLEDIEKAQRLANDELAQSILLKAKEQVQAEKLGDIYKEQISESEKMQKRLMKDFNITSAEASQIAAEFVKETRENLNGTQEDFNRTGFGVSLLVRIMQDYTGRQGVITQMSRRLQSATIGLNDELIKERDTVKEIDAAYKPFLDSLKSVNNENEDLNEETEDLNNETEDLTNEVDNLAEAMNKLNEEYKLQLKYAESLPSEQERAVAVLEATKKRLEGVQKLYQDIYFEDKFYSEDELQRLNDFNKDIALITEEIEKLKKAASEDNPFENWKPLDEDAGDVQGGEDEGKKSIWDILNDDDARDKLFRDIEAWANYATEVIGHVNQIISAGIERRINEETEAHEQDLEKWDAREKRIADTYGTESSQYQALLMQKERAEQVYNKKIADLKLKQAKLERNMRIFEITIQTALNVAKSYPNPYAMIAAGALGTVQTAAVLAQPLPQYYTGLDSADKDHVGVIADRGQELVQYPDGTTELYKKKQPIFIPKNTKIYDNSDTEKILNSLILSSLTPAKSENNQYDFDKLDRRLSDINRTIKRKPVANMKQGYSWSDINYIKKMDV